MLQSRTVWANIVGLAALLLRSLGFSTGNVEVEPLLDAILQLVTGFCFVASTVFRVLATRRLVP